MRTTPRTEEEKLDRLYEIQADLIGAGWKFMDTSIKRQLFFGKMAAKLKPDEEKKRDIVTHQYDRIQRIISDKTKLVYP